jgi:5'-3' exonuclease
MGVPAFFRWLSKRYPKVVIDALSEDELQHILDEYKSSTQKSDQKGDPNEINLDDFDSAPEREAMVKLDIENKIKMNNPEIDNLYLDMNGIIHPCTRPPGRPEPTIDTEMFNNIFEYVDKVIKITKP